MPIKISLFSFRDGSSNGGWLHQTEQVTHNKNKVALVLGSSLNSTHGSDIKAEALHVPGFQYLNWLLPYHVEVSETYFLLTALMMGQPVRVLPSDSEFDLDAVWAYLWGLSVSNQPISSIAPKVNICSEAAVVLLIMGRTLLHSDQNLLPEWLKNHPKSIIQVRF